jgi:hypothetical protein
VTLPLSPARFQAAHEKKYVKKLGFTKKYYKNAIESMCKNEVPFLFR